MVKAHKFDGMVLLGSCDKIVPGMLMAAARLNIPAIFCNSGPMMPAVYKGKHWDGNIVTEAIGWKKRGEINEAEFLEIENLAEPCVGSCAMLGTANTMGCLAEAMGMSLLGSAVIPAIYSKRMSVAFETGTAIMELVRNKVNARDIITKEAIENAITVLMGIGGSTNAIMHLQAIHKEAALGDLKLSTFDKLSKTVPQVASVYPASKYDMVDFYDAGGVPAVMKSLESVINGECLTVSGKTVSENLKCIESSEYTDIIKSMDMPFCENGGIAVVEGNLAPLGAICKPAAIPKHLQNYTGKARVFSSEDEACEAILNGDISPGTAIVLRYEGPKGGPGMPEMYRPMKSLEGMGLSDSCAIITDGRFSGSNRGLFVGHISPEAYEGGYIAFIENGDLISIDIENRSISLLVDEEVIIKRKENWVRVEKTVPDGYLNTYRKISKSAAEGAVVE